MRFDDRLKTALSQPMDNASIAKTQWAQLIDLLSQNPKPNDLDMIAAGLQRLRKLMSIVSEKDRVLGVQAIMGRLQSPPLLQLLVGDTSMVTLSAIRAAKLRDEQWVNIIPTLPTRARGFLRNRDDLGPESMNSLSIWASADFILPSHNIESHGHYEQELHDDSDDKSQANKSENEKSESFLIRQDINELDDTLILNPYDEVSDNENHPSLSDAIKIRKDDKRQRIDEIVEKIEKLRNRRDQYDAPQLPLEDDVNGTSEYLTEIFFSTDEHGTINWVDGVPRGALVGTSLAEPSYDYAPGPDASGAAAFKQRIPLENIRMKLCGAEIIDGDWRINAVPFFNDSDGRFKGYKGQLRRPNIAESAYNINNSSPTFDGKGSDSLQQLIHELRTPLGAIIGFAEIIEQQLFGPASAEYRMLAKTILEEGNRLLAGFDDLNVAVKIDSGKFQASLGVTNCNWLIQRVNHKLYPLLKDQKVELNIIDAENLRALSIENDDAERLFIRLLSALITAANSNEILVGRWQRIGKQKPMNQFIIDLPKNLLSMTEKQLLESTPEIYEDNIKAPLLGLGFSLRLVRNLANNIGGSLQFQKDIALLSLPATRETVMRNNENNIE